MFENLSGPAVATNTGRDSKLTACEDRLKGQGLFSLERRCLQGDLTASGEVTGAPEPGSSLRVRQKNENQGSQIKSGDQA